MSALELTGFVEASVRVATPLLLAALGETLAERGGVINLGIEGAMLSGALAAAIGASSGGVYVGVVAALVAGLAVAGCFAGFAITARADQIIVGTAVTLGSVGLTGGLARVAFGPQGPGLSLPTLRSISVPVISGLPVVGRGFFAQSALTYLGYVLVPLVWWLLFRTRWGLELRAAGESAESAHAAGVRVGRRRVEATLIGGALAGLAGASLVLGQVGTFAERMTAGRGFIAIAIVVLGGWRPVRVAVAALLFGAAMALQFQVQAAGFALPYQLLLMLPYLLTLLVLAGAVGRARAPADLARPLGWQGE